MKCDPSEEYVMKAMEAKSVFRKFRPCLVQAMLLVVIMCATAAYSHADTVNLTLVNVSPGYNDGSFYTYPYNFSINGSAVLTPMLCDDFVDDVFIGETWTATVSHLDTIVANGQMIPVAGSLAFGQTKLKAYLEAAYLYDKLYESLDATSSVNINHAIWALFSATSYNAASAALFAEADTNTSESDLSTFSDIVFFTPVEGTQTLNGQPVTSGPHDGRPQEFIGKVPEVSSLALLGFGLLGVVGLAYRKNRLLA
jgi:hypothetical protein